MVLFASRNGGRCQAPVATHDPHILGLRLLRDDESSLFFVAVSRLCRRPWTGMFGWLEGTRGKNALSSK